MNYIQAIHTPFLKPVDHYWADFLGCKLDLLFDERSTSLVTRADHLGIWAVSRRGGWVVVTPPDWCPQLQEQIRTCFQPNLLPNTQNLQRLLNSVGNQQPYGPALIFLHNLPPGKGADDPNIRPLTLSDHEQIAAFERDMGPLPWSLDEPETWVKIWGLFAEEYLVATCGVRVWGDLLAEIYVDTLPMYRRCGYGKAVTSAALRWIHTETPYQPESVVELSNQASLQLMKNLGFEAYAYMVTSFVSPN